MSLFSRIIGYVAGLPRFVTYIRRVSEIVDEVSTLEKFPELLRKKPFRLARLSERTVYL